MLYKPKGKRHCSYKLYIVWYQWDWRSLIDSFAFVSTSNKHYCTCMDRCTSSLSFRLQHYDHNLENIALKKERCPKVRVRVNMFGILEPSSIVSVLSAHQRACDINRINEGTAILLFSFFEKNSARALFSSRTFLARWRSAWQDSKLSLYWKFLNYLQKTWGTDEFIANSNMVVTNFERPGDKGSTTCPASLDKSLTLQDSLRRALLQRHVQRRMKVLNLTNVLNFSNKLSWCCYSNSQDT